MNLLRSCSRLLLLASLAFTALPPRAQAISPGFTVLKTFDKPGSEPMASPVQGPGGFLYAATYEGGAHAAGTLFKVRPDGTGYAVIYAFGGPLADGMLPWGVMVGSDGALYGSTDQGGTYHVGTLFKIQPDGTGYAILHTFSGQTNDGARPFCAPVQGPGGRLYGTTYGGGATGQGTVYSIAPDGSGFTVLHSFGGGAADGAVSIAELTVASDGNLYGVAQSGGAFSSGVVFKLHPDGSGFAVLHSFGSVTGDGVNPKKRLIQAADGALYGTTPGTGILFKLNLDGSGYTIVHSFSTTGSPEPGVIQASDGKLYGATMDGGTAFRGSLYRINPDGTGYTVLRSFLGGDADSWYPGSAPLQASDGALYGTSRFGGPTSAGGGLGTGTIYKLNLDGSGAATPFILPAASAEGGTPLDGLIQSSDGALYGTTSAGGLADAGTVIRIQPDGSGCTVLHSFNGGAIDGATANDSVLEANDGALYGVTNGGGTANAGIVYRLQRNGTGFTVLHSFTNGPADGGSPRGRLIQGSDGALYGTTYNGGAALAGTVFKINLDGSGYTVLYSFNAPGSTSDGMNPNAGVFQASDGGLYGTARNGGTYGVGVIFRLQRDGSGYTIIHNFTGSLTDYDPRGRLIQGSDGALYGTAYGSINFYGGISDYGCVFKLNPDGSGYRVLRVFAGGEYDGAFPAVNLIKAANGSLYGSTSGGVTHYGGGTIGNGTLFRVNEDGTGYSQLYVFTGGDNDGSLPTSLLQASNGDFYGMTYGSTGHSGLVFRATLADLAPAASDQTLTVTPATPVTVTLSGADPDHDTLTYLTVTAPANGMMTGTGSSLTYDPGSFTGTESLTYVVFDGAVFSNVATVTLNVGATASPMISLQPVGQVLGFGGTVDLAVTATGASPLSYQWYRDGNPIPGATSANYTAAVSGTYTVTINNSSGSATSDPAVVVSAAHLANVSGRANVTTGDSVLILGMVVTGAPGSPKHMLVRAAGPALSQYQIGTPLAQPQLTLYSGNTAIASNLGWGTAPNPAALAAAATTVGAFPFAAGSADSALLVDLLPGAYSVVVSSANGAPGIALAEAYEVDAHDGQLVNLSARMPTGTGDNVAIAGFVVTGSAPARVLVRGVGPGLTAFGVSGALAQPQLTVYANSTVLASNQGWGTAPDPAALAAAAVTAGAFPLATGSADCAVILTLPPGAYSAIVSGVANTTGMALVETYQLP